jgi:hypothetical protein
MSAKPAKPANTAKPAKPANTAKPAKPANCKNVISLKQYGPTCWFNSILMAILYSDESRKLLLEKSKKWNPKVAVYKTLKHILLKKYLRSDSAHNDYAYFDKIRPEFILKQLYRHNKDKFAFNPTKHKRFGYNKALYIRKVYKLLGVKVLYVDKLDDEIYYSEYNNIKTRFKGDRLFRTSKYVSYEKVKEKLNNPDVIIVNLPIKWDKNRYPDYYKLSGIASNFHIHNLKKINNLKTLEDVIVFDSNKYIQDSVLLNNWNTDDPKIGLHAIAGITCNGDRYVYNGWTRTTIDPNIMKDLYDVSPSKYAAAPAINIPCELMSFYWNVNRENNFCLNPKTCILDIMNVNKLCFSFNKGDRVVIYVKENKTSTLYLEDKPAKPVKTGKTAKPAKQCAEGKIRNPLTGRCISLKTFNKLPKNPLSIPEHPENPAYPDVPLKKPSSKKSSKPLSPKKKICPEGSILNPLTNRCNKIKKAPAPKNKILKEMIIQKKKICPEGSILNPITNRCNKIKKAPEPKVKNIKNDKSDKKNIKKIKNKDVNKQNNVFHNCPDGKVLNPLTKTCFDYSMFSDIRNR